MIQVHIFGENTDIRTAVKDMLESEGYRTAQYGYYKPASMFDVAVIDVGQANERATTLAERLKEEHNKKIIVLTTLLKSEDSEEQQLRKNYERLEKAADVLINIPGKIRTLPSEIAKLLGR